MSEESKTPAKAEAKTKTPAKAEAKTKTPAKAEAKTKTPAKAEAKTKTPAKAEATTSVGGRAATKAQPCRPGSTKGDIWGILRDGKTHSKTELRKVCDTASKGYHLIGYVTARLRGLGYTVTETRGAEGTIQVTL